jgi:hypothetical protein
MAQSGRRRRSDNDRMVPTPNSVDMAQRLPNAELVLYEDSGHIAIFQHHEDFVKRALLFLGRHADARPHLTPRIQLGYDIGVMTSVS